MKIEQHTLIEELLAATEDALVRVRKLKELPLADLNFKPSANEWSVLECIEHLNRYGKFYLPEIEKRLETAGKPGGKPIFRSGVLGNYMVGMVKAGNAKKMKTFKEMNPSGSDLTTTVIDQFIKQLGKLKLLLNESRQANLTRVKTSTTLSKLVKFRLGDALRFVVHHNDRHIAQAQRTATKAQSSQRVAAQ